MNFSSIIDNPKIPLVLDTSVVVNLNACTYGKRILAAIPNKIIIAKIAAYELKLGTDERAFLDDLVHLKMVELVDLTDREYEIYEKLTTSCSDLQSSDTGPANINLGSQSSAGSGAN